MPTGLYLSVPFCRTKCSYCNFASDVFSRAVFQRYVDRVCSEIEHAAETAAQMGAHFDPAIDSVYLGGGTPTVLDGTDLRRLFVTISQNFQVAPDAEITVECAPGTLSAAVIGNLRNCAVNRVSLGVQSFVDLEAAAVGRLHKRQTVEEDITRLRDAGIANINIDLIAGLPHQTAESWDISLAALVDSGAPHASVYMLEVDEDSRLGRELIAGGAKYHAHFVPDEDLTADFYVTACERLEAAGVRQYEISNFAREGCESRHNLKYWTRQPYLGFGVDAHSMLYASGAKAHHHSAAVVGLKAHASTAGLELMFEQARASAESNAVSGPQATRGSARPSEQTRGSAVSNAASMTGGDSGDGRMDAGDDVEGHGFSRAARDSNRLGFSPRVSSRDAIRFATPDSLEGYLAATPLQPTPVLPQAAIEEAFFLGLRLVRGINLEEIAAEFGEPSVKNLSPLIAEFVSDGLLETDGDAIRLTPRGRLLSNEVFERFIAAPA
jgi:oxygen-independent coproporphyrinogen-3 oxidase